jgi:hypothetical protein
MITNNGKKHTNYEDTDIVLKDRSTKSFIQWINTSLDKNIKKTKKRNKKNKNKSIKNII